jgi:phosphotransferase system  glucose/maltose/N-acetylglucosamine-specific IIC component
MGINKMPTIGEIIKLVLNEAKAAIKEYMQQTESAVKKRLKKILIFSIITAILLSLGISLAGAASLFLLIGSIKYLYTILPQWEAWVVMGITAAIAAAAFFAALFLIIKKQLSSPKTSPKQNLNMENTDEKR